MKMTEEDISAMKDLVREEYSAKDGQSFAKKERTFYKSMAEKYGARNAAVILRHVWQAVAAKKRGENDEYVGDDSR